MRPRFPGRIIVQAGRLWEASDTCGSTARLPLAVLFSLNLLPTPKQGRGIMRRQQLAEFMRRMGPNSVAVVPAAREATRSNDTEYRFRQDSDFYYLNGFPEPEAVAVLAPSREERYTLFVRPRDKEKEVWTGRRAGVEGAKEKFGADAAYPVEEFQEKLAELL